VLAELHSLDGVLDILKDDASSFPEALARRTPPLLEHCTSIVHQIEGYMHVCNGLGLSARDKKYRWMAIRGDMEKLRLTLEGYKSTLAVVTDLVGLCVPSLFSIYIQVLS
jgi:GTPase-activating protein SAC7